MSTPKKLILVGAGGAGLEALLVARRMGGWEVYGFADDAPELSGKAIDGVPLLGPVASVAAELSGLGCHVHLAVGRNALRRTWAALFEERGFSSATLVDPTAVVAASALVGTGSYLAPHAFVGPEAMIGRHVLVNVGASIGHHSAIEDFAQICPGGCLSGHARLGPGAFVGSNGVVAPGVRVGAWAVVGAASLAARDVPERFSAIGVPARMLAVPDRPSPE
jgi:sugar O-acyltransferase (sialic acid O-acetyltransferase NeuD family)